MDTRRKRFSFCESSFFLNEDSSFDVSVDDLLETTCYFRMKNLKVCLQLQTSDRIRCSQIGNRFRGFNIVYPYHCFNRTTCTRACFTPEMHSPHSVFISFFEIRPSFELKFSAQNTRTLCGISRTCSTFTGERSPCTKRTRLHSFNLGGVVSTHSSTTYGSRSRLICTLHTTDSHDTKLFVFMPTTQEMKSKCAETVPKKAVQSPLLRTVLCDASDTNLHYPFQTLVDGDGVGGGQTEL